VIGSKYKERLDKKKGVQMKQFEFKLEEGKFCRIEGVKYEDALWTFMQYKALGFPKGEILFSSTLSSIVAFSNNDGGWNYR
jgi:hypothetical protein